MRQCHTKSNRDTYCYYYTYRHTDADCYCYSDSNSKTYTDTQRSPGATTSSDSAAETQSLISE